MTDKRVWWPIWCSTCLQTVHAYQLREGLKCELCGRTYPWITAGKPLPDVRGR